MKLPLPVSAWFSAAIALGLASIAHAQPFYMISKGQHFDQRGAATVIPNPFAPFQVEVQTSINATVTSPANTPVPITLTNVGPGEFQFERAFATKTAMDALFPAGTYRITGTGIPALTLNLPEIYPTATPQVTQISNGAWSAGGTLVVNPTQATTITFNTFTEYASAGAASYMSANVWDFTGQTEVVSTEIVSQAVIGLPVQATPFTSITIPANRLTNGRIYELTVDFQRVPTVDTTTLAGGTIVSVVGKSTRIYISAQTGTPPAAPVITAQPASRTAVLGGSTTFQVAATIPGEYVIQWYKDGDEVDTLGGPPKVVRSGDGRTLTINSLTAADAGNYSMIIANGGGVVNSAFAALTVATASSAPTFSLQPSTQTVIAGNTVVFNALATGAPSPTYQWRRDNVNIAGATGPGITITNATAANAGTYTVVATSSAGTVTSTPATLTINAAGTVAAANIGRLTNLSVRTFSGAGAQALNVGVVVAGDGATGTKPLLVRVTGPALAGFGVPGTMLDPVLTLQVPGSSNVIATNNDWAGNASVISTGASVGAFPLTDTTSKDAALATSLAVGSYTVVAAGTNNTTGVVLTEIYDASSSAAFTATTPRLTNVSARAQVNTGDDVLIAGFVVNGTTDKTVLIRATGPALAAFGVPDTLADPKLEVFAGATKLTENDNWGGAPFLVNASTAVGAFQLSNAASKDAMLLLTLPPGSYSAKVTGADGGTGVALVEIYEMP